MFYAADRFPMLRRIQGAVGCVGALLLLAAVSNISYSEFRLERVSFLAGSSLSSTPSAPPTALRSCLGAGPMGRSVGGSWHLVVGPLVPAPATTSSIDLGIPPLTALLDVIPNPTSLDPTVSFQISTAEPVTEVRADLYDVRGRRVRSVFHELLPNGTYERAVAVHGTEERMANGVYVLRMSIGHLLFTERLVVVR